MSEEEVKAMVSLGANEGTLEKHEQEFIENVLEFNDILVEDVMTPRTQIFAAEMSTKLKDLISFKYGRRFFKNSNLQRGYRSY